ncbi:MAG: hypothetical protein Q7U87_00765 [bacterium]|nr:hypothetical protein [bacterium]
MKFIGVIFIVFFAVSCANNRSQTPEEQYLKWSKGMIDYTVGYAKIVKHFNYCPIKELTILEKYISKNANKLKQLDFVRVQNNAVWENSAVGDDADFIKVYTDYVMNLFPGNNQSTLKRDSSIKFLEEVIARNNNIHLEKSTYDLLKKNCLIDVYKQAIYVYLLPSTISDDDVLGKMPGFVSNFNDSTATFYLFCTALNYQLLYQRDTLAFNNILFKMQKSFNLPQTFVDRQKGIARNVIFLQNQIKEK